MTRRPYRCRSTHPLIEQLSADIELRSTRPLLFVENSITEAGAGPFRGLLCCKKVDGSKL